MGAMQDPASVLNSSNGDVAAVDQQDDNSSDRLMTARLDNSINPTTPTDDDMSESFPAMSLAGSNNIKSPSILSSQRDSDADQGTVIVVPTKILPASAHAGDAIPPSVNTVCNDQSHHQRLPTMSTQPLPELLPASVVTTTQHHRAIASVSTLL